MILGNKSDLERNRIPDNEINDVLEGMDHFKINDKNFINFFIFSIIMRKGKIIFI
jgi:hypothetical protein